MSSPVRTRRVAALLGPLADGSYTYTALPTDLAGNVGTMTAPFVVTVDTPAPAAPTQPADLIDADDTGASNQDIANRLVLTVGTVKGHINHILGKLGVSNRTEAVAKARQRGFIN